MVPADIGDLIRLFEAQGKLKLGRPLYGALIAQVSLSESFAVYASSRDRLPLAVAGIAPLGKTAGEIWFGVQAGGVGRYLILLVRATRRVLAARRSDYPDGFMCLVRDDNAGGRRLATLIGFEPKAVMFNDHREWNWRGA